MSTILLALRAVSRKTVTRMPYTGGLRVSLSDPHVLAHIRAKVARATEKAEGLSCAACSDGKVLGWAVPRSKGRFLPKVKVYAHDFSPCYPASIGPDTRSLDKPDVAAADAETASYVAQGDAQWVAQREAPAFLNVIDRTEAVRRVGFLRTL